MKKLFFLFALLLLFRPLAWAQHKEIEALIRPYVQTNNFSGSVLIVQNGKPVFSKAYGLMNKSYHLPNKLHTKFYLASVSMILTSAAIMKLVEEQKISLTDPLSKYLPDYKYGDRITLHHLMSQRSGIPAIGQQGKIDYDSITKFRHSSEQLVAYVKEDSLLFQPDAAYNHGRSDYILLAYIIEQVTGKPFGTYLQEAIFDPLQMKNTGHSGGTQDIVTDLAAGYAPAGHYDLENADPIDWSSKTGHGSIYSTAEDLNRFAGAILQHTLLSEHSWEKIFTDYGSKVGYGWYISDHLDKKRYQMNGRSPGFSSYFGIYPDDNLVVIVLSNNYISLPADIGKQLAALVFKKPYTKTNLSVATLTSEQANRLTGKYKFDENFYIPNFEMEVAFKEGKLSATWGALIPVGDNKQPGNKFILRTYWSEIQFTSNSNDQIDTMLVDGYKGIKIN